MELKPGDFMKKLAQERREETIEKLAEHRLPVAIVMMVTRVWMIDPTRRIDVFGDVGSTRIVINAWYGLDKREDEILRLLISLRFQPDGVSSLLSGHWVWHEPSEERDGNDPADSSVAMVKEFIAASMEDNAIRDLRNRAKVHATAMAFEEKKAMERLRSPAEDEETG